MNGLQLSALTLLLAALSLPALGQRVLPDAMSEITPPEIEVPLAEEADPEASSESGDRAETGGAANVAEDVLEEAAAATDLK